MRPRILFVPHAVVGGQSLPHRLAPPLPSDLRGGANDAMVLGVHVQRQQKARRPAVPAGLVQVRMGGRASRHRRTRGLGAEQEGPPRHDGRFQQRQRVLPLGLSIRAKALAQSGCFCFAPDINVACKKCTIIKIKVSNLWKRWNKFAYIEIK